jgi:1-phosphatidylinositol-4-phosphate 5-kinase
MHKTNTNNPTLQRNENEALKSERRGESEDGAEPRVISTVRSPSADRSGGMQGQTLPVVEELGEASSMGGRSGRSRERPLTPAKDDDRPLTPAKDYSPAGNGHHTIKGRLSRSSLDKELPPLPPVGSPEEMNGGDNLAP